MDVEEVAEAYCLGRLPATVAAEFEEHLLAWPRCREVVGGAKELVTYDEERRREASRGRPENEAGSESSTVDPQRCSRACDVAQAAESLLHS